MRWVRAAALDEIAEGAVLSVELDGRKVCLARADGELYALADNCSHRDFPLSLGEVNSQAGTITCEWHGAEFDLRSGDARCPPATRAVPVYPTRVDGDGVYVELPD